MAFKPITDRMDVGAPKAPAAQPPHNSSRQTAPPTSSIEFTENIACSSVVQSCWPARTFACTSSSLAALASPLDKGRWSTTGTSQVMFLRGVIDEMKLPAFSPSNHFHPKTAVVALCVAGPLKACHHYLGGADHCRGNFAEYNTLGSGKD